MLKPTVQTPFPVQWGFSTRLDDSSELPHRRLAQVHGTDIWEASETVCEGDGQWTQRPGERIGIRVADCVPVLLAGLVANGPWVAALHAGWRGAVGGHGKGDAPGILRRAVLLFQSLGGNPEQLCWALGPSIQKCHFEVGPEVIDAARRDPAWRNELAESSPNGRFQLDLHGFLRGQAMDLGLSLAKDGSVQRCTWCEPELFYSFRRGDQTQRQWGWIEICEERNSP